MKKKSNHGENGKALYNNGSRLLYLVTVVLPLKYIFSQTCFNVAPRRTRSDLLKGRLQGTFQGRNTSSLDSFIFIII